MLGNRFFWTVLSITIFVLRFFNIFHTILQWFEKVMIDVNNRNTRITCEKQLRHQNATIYAFSVFLLLTLNKQMFAGNTNNRYKGFSVDFVCEKCLNNWDKRQIEPFRIAAQMSNCLSLTQLWILGVTLYQMKIL